VNVEEFATLGGDLPLSLKRFAKKLRRDNKAPRTISTYVEDSSELIAHLAGKDAADLTGADINSYLDSLWDRGLAAATVAKRFRSIQQFCKWLEEDGEVAVSPMAGMKPPAVPDKPVPVIPDSAFELMLKDIILDRRRNLFEARRDEAIFRVFADCGVRLQELTELTVESVNLDTDELRVFGKGRRFRIIPFDDDTATAIHKYLRERANHPAAKTAKFVNPDNPSDPRNGEPLLWLGTKGALRYTGVLQMVKRRSRASLGIEGHMHPHQLRHTAAHQAAKAGLSETEMMRLFGWKSDAMPKLYGASAADERARDAKRAKGLGNRFKV
jgi:site-specific recombinase XerC